MPSASLTRSCNRIGLWVIAAGLLFLVPAVFAQDLKKADSRRAAASDDATTAAAAKDDESVIDMILKSGTSGVAFMVVLGMFSLIGTTIAIERAVNTSRNKIIPSDFVGELKALTLKADTDAEGFSKLCARSSSPIATILSAGVLRCGRPLLEVEKSMEDAAAREMDNIRGGMRALTIIGNISPLVGLLGTVVGMIIAFRVASQSGLGKGELMAQGIYLALLTTAAGLMIAIPCLVSAAYFNSRVERFFREIDESLMSALPCFARLEQK